jgi:hypothetical protein
MYETISAIAFFIAGYVVNIAVRTILETKRPESEDDGWLL